MNTLPQSIIVAAKWMAARPAQQVMQPSRLRSWPAHAPGYSPTLNVKLPSTLCVSADITFHSTL